MRLTKTPKPVLSACVAWLLMLAGCASVQEMVPVIGERYRVRNEGYSLLYELASKQSKVAKILFVKNASVKVSDEIKAIGQTFGEAHKQLDAFAKKDARLRLRGTPLPTLEQKTRESIDTTTTKRLIFSSSKEFELQLLLTQVQALDYGSHLARELRGQDDNKDRKAFLDQFSKRCEQHHQKVIELLTEL